ncbi:MAG: PBP1A family penicillin-binding protein [candidate division NC10 bacterium]|nr:PBP1A family penicillin-binding protein [candidate division NC10 bacterium]
MKVVPRLPRLSMPVVTLALLLAGHAILLSPALGYVADPEKDLPYLDRLEIFQPGEPSILYSDRDEPFAALASEYRVFVPLQRVPKLVQQALLDAEDAQFYRHGAISLKGMARAAIRNLTSARLKEGGSTITQQLAKSLFLTPERTLSRKLKELQLAQEIERRYSKDKILEMYLNTIYFGGGSYGIEAAARTYFSKSVGQLSLAEAALLAGLPKAPSLYSPFTDPKRAKERRDYVLTRMEKEGHIKAAEAKAAMRLPIALAPFFKGRGMAPSFADFVRKELEPRFGRVLLTRGNLRIYTTLNLETQRTATEALRRGLTEIEKTLAGKRKAGAHEPAVLEGALVALDPESGEIRAMVGGRDYGRSQFNRAVQARRQPGSAFKPFVYAAAFDQGFTPATLMDDYPISYSIPQNGRLVEWSPENFDRQFRGPVTLRRALEESINVPTVRLLERVGVGPVISLAHRMGITSNLRQENALALGVSEVTLLELTSAYGVLANRGVRVPPRGVRRVASPSGDVLEAPNDSGERVLREEVAFQVTSVLQGAVERGTAKRARIPGRAVAAKTGTSQDAADIWLVGYTPRLAAGMWAGFDQPRSLGSHESAGRLAAPIWADFMRRALQELPPETPPIPEGVFTATVNWRTGFPTGPDDPEAITEFFISGDVAEPGEPMSVPSPPATQPLEPLPEPAGQR